MKKKKITTSGATTYLLFLSILLISAYKIFRLWFGYKIAFTIIGCWIILIMFINLMGMRRKYKN